MEAKQRKEKASNDEDRTPEPLILLHKIPECVGSELWADILRSELDRQVARVDFAVKLVWLGNNGFCDIFLAIEDDKQATFILRVLQCNVV